MKIRKKRPTLKDAHDYYKRGFYSMGAEDYISTEERREEASRIRDELFHLATKGIPRSRNLEYVILKCHLITEYAITQYIRFSSEPLVDPKDIRFTYSQKLNIAFLMGFGVADPITIPTLELLNRIRNQVAHTFELDMDLVNEMIRINSEEYHEFEVPSLTNQLRALKYITQYTCGAASGLMTAKAHLVPKYEAI